MPFNRRAGSATRAPTSAHTATAMRRPAGVAPGRRRPSPRRRGRRRSAAPARPEPAHPVSGTSDSATSARKKPGRTGIRSVSATMSSQCRTWPRRHTAAAEGRSVASVGIGKLLVDALHPAGPEPVLRLDHHDHEQQDRRDREPGCCRARESPDLRPPARYPVAVRLGEAQDAARRGTSWAGSRSRPTAAAAYVLTISRVEGRAT